MAESRRPLYDKHLTPLSYLDSRRAKKVCLFAIRVPIWHISTNPLL